MIESTLSKNPSRTTGQPITSRCLTVFVAVIACLFAGSHAHAQNYRIDVDKKVFLCGQPGATPYGSALYYDDSYFYLGVSSFSDKLRHPQAPTAGMPKEWQQQMKRIKFLRQAGDQFQIKMKREDCKFEYKDRGLIFWSCYINNAGTINDLAYDSLAVQIYTTNQVQPFYTSTVADRAAAKTGPSTTGDGQKPAENKKLIEETHYKVLLSFYKKLKTPMVEDTQPAASRVRIQRTHVYQTTLEFANSNENAASKMCHHLDAKRMQSVVRAKNITIENFESDTGPDPKSPPLAKETTKPKPLPVNWPSRIVVDFLNR